MRREPKLEVSAGTMVVDLAATGSEASAQYPRRSIRRRKFWSTQVHAAAWSGGRAVRVGGRVTALNAACLVLHLCSWECVVALGSAHAPHNCAVARLSYLRGQILAMWCFPRRRRPRHAECDGPRQCGVGAAADRFSRAVRRTTGTWPNGQRTAAAADRRRQEARLGHPDSSNCSAH